MSIPVDREIFISELFGVIQSALDANYLRDHQVMFSDASLIWAHTTIRKTIEELNNICIDNELADIKQEFFLLYIQYENKFDQRPQKSSFKSYITRRVTWGIRDWLVQRSQVVNHYSYYYFIEEKPEFVLDLNFLLHGTKIFPLSALSPYERYLIFLHFREEKSILEISRIVQHTRKTVQKRLDTALLKLRRLGNESKDTAGSSRSRDGASTPGNHQEGSCPGHRELTSKVSNRDS